MSELTVSKLLGRRVAGCVFVLAVLAAGCSSGSGSAASTSSASTGASTKAAPTKGAPGDASAGDPSKAAYTPTGPLVADNGFRPEVDGFTFANYGKSLDGQRDAVNLGPAEVRKLFGDAVCADARAGKCDLIPPAQQWMDQANKATEGGHCQGFSVLSGLLWKKLQTTSDFGGSTTPDLKVDNEALQRSIAYAFMFQTLSSYNAAIVKGTPTEILDKLLTVLNKDNTDSYTIGIYKPGFQGGHAVTPYAVEDAGNGIFNVLIYDNNFPKVTRAIKIDRNANTWSYDAATNPQNPSELYQGDATTKTIDLEPTSAGIGPQPCPFCGNTSSPAVGGRSAAKSAQADAAAPMDEIYLDGSDVDHAHLLITDSNGHRLGYANGNFVSEIAGANALFPKASQTWVDAPEPDYFVPAEGTYSVTVDGSALQEADPTTVGVIGPSFDLTVDNLDIQPGEKSTFTVVPDLSSMSFVSSGAQTPSIDLGVSDIVDYAFSLSGATIAANKAINIDLPVNGGKLILNAAPRGTYNLTLDRFDEDGELSFKHDGVALSDGDTATLQFGSWTAKDQSIPLDITHDGSSSTQTLANQA